MSTEKILEVHHITKHVFQGESQFSILTGIDLVVKSGETVALIGESGSGKSTLLSILAGLDDASTGKVELFGNNLAQLDEDARAELRAKHVGFVFQSFMLIPTLNALENVQLPLFLQGAEESVSRPEAEKLLRQVGLEHRLYHFPSQLSGGEQQRVALARAFSGKPQLLFADEPTGNLDRKTGENVVELLFELNTQLGTTLILVTHDESLAARCQRCYRLLDGQLHEVTFPSANTPIPQHKELA